MTNIKWQLFFNYFFSFKKPKIFYCKHFQLPVFLNKVISSQSKQKKKLKKKKKKKKKQCEASPKISTGNIRKSGILSRIVCVCMHVAWLNCEKWSTYKLYHSPVNVHPCRIFSDETDIACRRITCCIVLKTMRMHRINNWSFVCACACVFVWMQYT